MSGIRNEVPWWLLIGAKMMLARLPLNYSLWKRLRLFEHGDMNQPKKALDTFLEHARTADVLDMKGHLKLLSAKNEEFTVLELGPGDSLFSIVIAKSFGASRTWLVDSGPFAIIDMNSYTELFNYLRLQGIAVQWATEPQTADDLLKKCNGVYLTDGVNSLARLPASSVNYCFSNAVLEHIPKSEFTLLAKELFRVLKPDGISVHRVDLKDHLGGGLNNLRFSEMTWEGSLFRKSGFYTNRFRCGEMLAMFEQAGFDCRLPRMLRWETLPMKRNKMAIPFRYLSDDDLLMSGFDVVLTKHPD